MLMYKEQKELNRKRIDHYLSSEQNGKVDFYPAYIQIEQTNRCNAECIMCNHFYLGNRRCNDLDRAIIEKIEAILPYCETIMLNGDGEPFLCPTIAHNILCFYNYGVKIGTNTNLSYVPEELWDSFSDTFGFLNISCDGACAETYEMIRRGLKWEIFISNLSHLSQVAPELVKNFDCVVSKHNVKELAGIVELAADYGIRKVKFHRLGVNPCIGNDVDQAEYYFRVLGDSLASAKSAGQSRGVEVIAPAFQAYQLQLDLPGVKEMAEEINKRKIKSSEAMKFVSLADDYFSQTVTADDWISNTWCAHKACQWAIERCYIDIRGNVTTCCFNMKKNMGSLAHLTFDEIWNGQDYVALRKLMANQMLPAFCKECNWIKESKF